MRTTRSSKKKNILLQADDDDAMEEDEEDVLMDHQQPSAPDVAVIITTRELISTMITPSPFPHHTSGPTSSRFRTSLQRIQANPDTDVDAWQALMTEVGYCYRQILPKIHMVDAEVQLQLDWIESCYGYLLQRFPYSATHFASVAEILLSQSAQLGEEQGPIADYGGIDRRRQQTCQAKLERIFEVTLGVNMDGTVAGSSDDDHGDATTSNPNGGTSKPTTSSDDSTSSIGGMCTSSTDLWLLYIKARERHARRINPNDSSFVKDSVTKAYDLALQYTGFGFQNHVMWKAYLTWAKSTSSDDPQQMIFLRGIYQRLVCNPMLGLDQLWQEYEVFERQQSEALATALVAEFTPKKQHARTVYLERNRVVNAQDLQLGTKLATPPQEANIAEEHHCLQLWKTRLAYERTNPERLTPGDLTLRVRTAYKEMASVWTRHPEVWHMWSAWEDNFTGAGGTQRAMAVLEKGQEHLPDCTLLAMTHAQLWEIHDTDNPSHCLQVMEKFLERAPNTLGFTLYQQLVRRYKGVEEARSVFAKARRILKTVDGATAGKKADDAKGGGAGGKVEDSQEGTDTIADKGKRWMVTNRLDPNIGTGVTRNGATVTAAAEATEAKSSLAPPGPITYHLYAAHAMMEHRLNRSPSIAARIYELGLRKHSSFLTKPAYVLKYANLLLELQDNINLRALLTRALATCTERTPSVAALWDIAIQFESIISLGDSSNLKTVLETERKRRAALLGPDVEDVASGSRVGMADQATIGAQKATIAEQLVRQDGYDANSAVVSGMSRAVDVLDVMGLWGSGLGNSRLVPPNSDDAEEIPGGESDALFQKRLWFARLTASGGTMDTIGEGGSKQLSARERLQNVGGASQNTAFMMAIQNSPEWLRPLLLMLPASRSRVAVVSPPPLQITEMALSTLRRSKLPADRPQDDKKGTKRGRDNGGDSSDDESGLSRGGGYGSQFRERQKARMTTTMGVKVEN